MRKNMHSVKAAKILLVLSLFTGFLSACSCDGDVGSIVDDASLSDVKIKKCTNSAQCSNGEVCSNNICVPSDGGIICRNKGDCPSNMDCVNGQCKELVDVEVINDVEGIEDVNEVYSGKIEVLPDKLDFGAGVWGIEVRREVRIRNIGKGVLRVSDIRFSPGTNPDSNNPKFRYEIVGGKVPPLFISEGQEESINVIYKQDDSKPDNGYLQILSSDSNYPIIDIFLYSHYKDNADLNIVDTNRDPEELLYPKSGDVAKYVINMGDLTKGEESVKKVSIKNNSQEAILEISEATLANLSKNGFEVKYLDSKDNNKEYKPPIYISAGYLVDMVIKYAPKEDEIQEKSRVTLKTTDQDINNDGIGDDGVLEIEIVGRCGYKAMDIDVKPDGLSFGEVEVGTEERSKITICNVGGDDLVIDNSSGLVGMGGGFRIEPDKIGGTISSGGCKDVDVIFAPQSLGVKEDKLIIRSNDPDESILEVKLYGEGTDPRIMVIPSIIDFKQVKVGEVSDIYEVAITNTGVGNLFLEGIDLTVGTTKEFELLNLPDSYPVSLKGAGAGVLKIGIRYRPSGEGKDSGAVEIKSSDNDNKVVYVSLNGEGIKACVPSCTGKDCGDDGCGGSCGVCGNNSTCSNNKCVCNSGYANCDNDLSDGCEVDLNSINSCGTSCYNKVVCSSTNGTNPVCDNGVCRLSCNSGYADCNSGVGSSDGCEVNLNNPSTCGTVCGNITNCGQNSDCLLGVCECKSGYENCDGLWSNGCERNLTNDANNCGSCGNSCGTNGICVSSHCECISPYLNCNGLLSDGCEVNKNIDVSNCGGCNNICDLPNTAVNGCVSGSCKVVSCVNGYDNCNGLDSDGCEVNKNIDVNNCGGCGNKCGQNSVCNNGTCGCQTGFANCDSLWSTGCETNLSSTTTCGTSCQDIINCGNNTVCNAGYCECAAGFADCDNSWTTGCEKPADVMHLWSKTFGGSSDDVAEGVAVDSSGNLYVVGYFYSSSLNLGGSPLVNNNSSTSDIFLAKYNSKGTHIWSKRFGGSGNDIGRSIAVDSLGNVYIAGWFSSSSINFGGSNLSKTGYADVFIAKFDTDGNHLWSNRFGGTDYNEAFSVKVDSSNNVYLAGYFTSPAISFGGSNLANAGGSSCNTDGYFYCADIFVAKFNGDGVHQWSKKFGGTDWDIVYSMFVDKDNNVYITGWFDSSSIDFGGGAFTNVYSPYSDIYLAKFDSSGTHLWSKKFGGSQDDAVFSVYGNSNGDVYLTGAFRSSSINFGGSSLNNASYSGYADIFLAKFNSSGTHLWSKRFGGLYEDGGFSVVVNSSDNVLLKAVFNGSTIDFGGGNLTNAGNFDIALAKFDNNGNHIWSKRFGGSGDDGFDINSLYLISSDTIDSNGKAYIDGFYKSSTINLGGCNLSNNGGADIFILKYDP